MTIQIIKPDAAEPMFKYTLKDGTVIKYDRASELGEASVLLGFCNPYEPMTFEYDCFESGRSRKAAKRQEGE